MDWARSASPRDEKEAAAHRHGPEASIRAHTKTHTAARTEDETTLCQHRAAPAMLMNFI